ncbi:hypothetical protein [Leptospira yasudae]|uniref:hypothetical protein n=1 Tax=Leptospira yasudae TaxID=2202201 RepID=UPI001090B453|nr:hypothetical protein [Leptospira yasudae]TGM96884.1 hypothetical protein EHR10_14020 [Leptospira yasudae]
MKYLLVLYLFFFLSLCSKAVDSQCVSETKGQIVSMKPILYKSRDGGKSVVLDYLPGKYFYICKGEYLGKKLDADKLVKGFYIVEGTQKPSEEYYFNIKDLYIFGVKYPARLEEFNGTWSNSQFSSNSEITYEIDVKNKRIVYQMSGRCKIENNEIVCEDEFSEQRSKLIGTYFYEDSTLQGTFSKLIDSKGIEHVLSLGIKNINFTLSKCSSDTICNNFGTVLLRKPVR